MKNNTLSKEYSKIISFKLKLLMEANGVSQTKLSKMCGVSQQAVSKWLAGTQSPKENNLRVIADFFDVNYNDFFENNDTFYKRFEITDEALEDVLDVIEKHGNTEVVLSTLKNNIIDRLNNLNRDGLTNVYKYTDDLTKIDKYTKKPAN